MVERRLEEKKPSCPTKRCSNENQAKVLNAVGKAIKINYDRGIGTIVKDLGTFTSSQWKIKIDGKKYLLVKEPIFLISEKLVNYFNLKADKKFTPARISTKLINYLTIEAETRLDKHMIESCIKHFVQRFMHDIKSEQKATINFPSVGTLYVVNKRVKMAFDRCFLSATKTETIQREDQVKETLISKQGRNKLISGTKETDEAQKRKMKETESNCGDLKPAKPEPAPSYCKICKAKGHWCRCKSKATAHELNDTLSVISLTPSARKQEDLHLSEAKSISNRSIEKSKPPDEKPVTQIHPPFVSLPGADPDLCYMCQMRHMRRETYGIPDEPKEVIDAKEKILNADIFRMDAEGVIEDIKKCEKRREKNKEFSAFNKLLAEENREKNKLDLKHETPMAYIFAKRPDTPPVSPRAWEENRILGEERKRAEREAMEKEKKIDNERTELSIKSEEEERWESMARKERNHLEYRKLLDAQIKHKEEYYKMFPNVDDELLDSSKPEFTIPNIELEKRVAQDLDTYRKCQVKYQKEREEREKEEKLNYEKAWLKMLAEEGQKERDRKSKLKCDLYQDLLHTWKEDYNLKLARDKEEKDYLSLPAGSLLRELVHRCKHCFRNLGCPAQKITDTIKV